MNSDTQRDKKTKQFYIIKANLNKYQGGTILVEKGVIYFWSSNLFFLKKPTANQLLLVKRLSLQPKSITQHEISEEKCQRIQNNKNYKKVGTIKGFQ